MNSVLFGSKRSHSASVRDAGLNFSFRSHNSWENRRIARGAEPLVDPAILRNLTLRGGLTSFFFQYLLQGGLFFAVPLFLSVALGLSAIATGVRLLPLSITLLLAAAGIPKVFPNASPRRVVQIGSPRDIYYRPANRTVAQFVVNLGTEDLLDAMNISAADFPPAQLCGIRRSPRSDFGESCRSASRGHAGDDARRASRQL